MDYVVLDLETLHSATDCRRCGREPVGHPSSPVDSSCQGYAKIGWEDPPALGLAIGCYWESHSQAYTYFDSNTLEDTMVKLVGDEPLLVTYNGKQFDGPLMAACVEMVGYLDNTLLADWQGLCDRSYDILAEIWRADPQNKFQKGNGLDAVAQANGYGMKLMSGALAPRLWAEGRHAEVVNYCADDVLKTRLLFEQICRGEPIQHQAGPVRLPMPEGICTHEKNSNAVSTRA